jgi:DNA-binding NarL/FixJ family response regulator
VNAVTVLLVDDDTMVLRAMMRAFSGLDADVVTADRAFGLLNKIAELRPAVVVLDVRMPGLDGASLVQLIREDPAIAGTRVLLHSGLAADALAATALACGADGWAAKQAGIAGVVAAVRRLLPLGAGSPRMMTPALGSPLRSGLNARAADVAEPRPEVASKPTIRGMPAVRFLPSSLTHDER